MKWFIILMSLFAVIHSRPQKTQTHNEEPTVELEKQTIVEVTPNLRKYVDQFPHPTQRKMEDNTKEILEKIAEVNKRHGLVSRKERPNYFHFPFSYSRSQDDNPHKELNKERTFSSSPFSNPILEYLIATKDKNEDSKTKIFSTDEQDESDDDENHGYEKSISNSDITGITKEDMIPGQYIKRKIVHQQTFAVPMPNMYPSQPNFMAPQAMPNLASLLNMPPSAGPIAVNFPQISQPQPPSSNENKEKANMIGDRKTLNSLEKQTIDNVKNIVSSTQMQQSQAYPLLYNSYPYLQYPQANVDQYQYGSLPPSYRHVPEELTDEEYSYRIYGPYTLPNSEKGRQNWNWPGANYFPIYIRDPFLQFYNAITSMVEYGPNAGSGGPCKRPPKIKGKEEGLTREAKKVNQEREQIVVEMGDKASGQITIYGASDEDNNTSGYLDIENINIGGSKESGLKFTVSLAPSEREAKDSEERIALKTAWDKTKEIPKSVTSYDSSRTSSKFEKFAESPKDIKAPPIIKPQVKPLNNSPSKQPIQNPPIKDPTIHVEEVDDEFDEEEKSEDISISNDGNKKMFSRDNTGSGIFIHKLKVRKGGVAIAGPGGIATAGSGGTAIVGPNGVAFTQPDSLAIAGSGTKVVAVDPTINLGDLINNTSLGNKTNGQAFPPSRVGKVVAVGPVIYYNKGLITFPNGLRFPKWLPHPDHQSQFFGNLHNPSIFNPKRHIYFDNFHPSQPATSSSSQFYHFPRYHKNPETLTIHGLHTEPTKSIPTKLSDKTNVKKILLHTKMQDVIAQKPSVVSSVKEELRVDDVLKGKNQIRLETINLDSLAPYRAHPLLHYLKYNNTIKRNKIFSIRNGDVDNDITTLILKPVARAIAGAEGKAVSTPVSKAVLRPGTNVDILFEPEAVAIAGAGGIAHAESDLEISYEEVI